LKKTPIRKVIKEVCAKNKNSNIYVNQNWAQPIWLTLLLSKISLVEKAMYVQNNNPMPKASSCRFDKILRMIESFMKRNE